MLSTKWNFPVEGYAGIGSPPRVGLKRAVQQLTLPSASFGWGSRICHARSDKVWPTGQHSADEEATSEKLKAGVRGLVNYDRDKPARKKGA
jgi:hypothetical protein